MYFGWLGCSFSIFFIASVTDFFDGFVARWFNGSTRLGKVLDPLADKILLVCSFCALAFLPHPLFQVPLWFIGLLLLREMTLVCGAYFLLKANPTSTVEPLILGKVTTFFQLLFIGSVFVSYFLHIDLLKMYTIPMVFLTVLSSMSLLQYVFRGVMYWLQSDKV